jgi:hypothetical protein
MFRRASLAAVFLCAAGVLTVSAQSQDPPPVADPPPVVDPPPVIDPPPVDDTGVAEAQNTPQNQPSGASVLVAQRESAAARTETDADPDLELATYRFFFGHLATLDRVATRLEAAGKDGLPFRTHDQRAAGLSREDGVLLKHVAYDCLRQLAEQDAKVRAAIAAFRAQNAAPDLRTIEAHPEFAELDRETALIISSHIDALRSQLGSKAFGKVDAYVHASFHPVEQPAPAGQGSQTAGAGR